MYIKRKEKRTHLYLVGGKKHIIISNDCFPIWNKQISGSANLEKKSYE